jgi:hypothetical protein
VVVVTGGVVTWAVVTGGVVIAVPAPTRRMVAAGVGSGLSTAGVPTMTAGWVTVVTTPADTAATTGTGRTRACGAVVVVSVASGFGTVVSGLVLGAVGFRALGFFVGFKGFALALTLAGDFVFTLTARVAALIGAVRIEDVLIAVALIADVLIADVLTATVEMAVVRRPVVRNPLVRRWALAGPMSPTLRKTVSAKTKRFRERQAQFEFGCSGESVTPGNAFDMRQGYARDVTIR